MTTENLSTLKIHKLTQEQYDRELAAGRIDENALYLTPDEEIDLSGYATKEEIPTGALAWKDKVSKSDLDSSVQSSLDKADTALQSFTETDPTVPDWAKQPTKPTYTAEEVGALPADTVIPTTEGLATESYVDAKVANLVNSAPETLDTLGELATAMQENESVVNTLNQAIANKADNTTVENLQNLVNGKAENSALNDHTSNTTIHITAVERTTWNAKMDADAELITTADIDAICGSVTPIAEVLF